MVKRRLERIKTPAELGSLVREQRRRLSLSQVELSELTQSGPRFVGELERGKPTLQLGKVLHVLASLGLTVQLEVVSEDEQ